jgi:uncharacterized protein YggE
MRISPRSPEDRCISLRRSSTLALTKQTRDNEALECDPGNHAKKREAMKTAFALTLALVLSQLTFAQDRPTVSAQPNTVFVGADGKFEANPDTALMQFNISAQEATSREAYDRASKEAEQVRQILRSNGIDPKSAEIGYFSLQPVYDYKTAKRKLVAYRVNANVSLKLKDFSKIAPIVQQLADADVSENQSLSYTLEDIDAAKAKAVEDAYKRASESAAVLARSARRTLGELSYASVDTFENVRPMPMAGAMMKMSAAAPAPTEEFTPQSVSVTAHVNALFSLK